jgi:hypothetical protein
MATINKKSPSIYTHEGAKAMRVGAEAQLRRSVMSCLLWEREFYEDGQDIAQRINDLVQEIPDDDLIGSIAVEARTKQKLRHVPLWIAVCLARKHSSILRLLLPKIIQRADELTEFLALYWKDGKRPLANSVKKGLAIAFQNFNEYQLAKYNRDNAVKLRDVLFLSHAKPKDGVAHYTRKERKAGMELPPGEGNLLFHKLVNGQLTTPDTWEVALSAGDDKKASWERLIVDKKLGALALLRNLRNMQEVKVPDDIIRHAILDMKTQWVLPFRFLSAARYAPGFEDVLELAMFKSLEGSPKLPGVTVLLVDNSGSMYSSKVSAKSELTRADAACALAVLLREICEQVRIVSFAELPSDVPPRRGFALIDAIKATPSGNTMTGDAIRHCYSKPLDRIIVITDEQSHQSVQGPPANVKAYFVNVASNKNGIGYGPYHHIDGWSESIVSYIQAVEGLNAAPDVSED